MSFMSLLQDTAPPPVQQPTQQRLGSLAQAGPGERGERSSRAMQTFEVSAGEGLWSALLLQPFCGLSGGSRMTAHSAPSTPNRGPWAASWSLYRALTAAERPKPSVLGRRVGRRGCGQRPDARLVPAAAAAAAEPCLCLPRRLCGAAGRHPTAGCGADGHQPAAAAAAQHDDDAAAAAAGSDGRCAVFAGAGGAGGHAGRGAHQHAQRQHAVRHGRQPRGAGEGVGSGADASGGKGVTTVGTVSRCRADRPFARLAWCRASRRPSGRPSTRGTHSRCRTSRCSRCRYSSSTAPCRRASPASWPPPATRSSSSRGSACSCSYRGSSRCGGWAGAVGRCWPLPAWRPAGLEVYPRPAGRLLPSCWPAGIRRPAGAAVACMRACPL